MSEEKKVQASKRRNRLNLIDVFLIVFLVLIIGAFLAYRFFIAGDAGQTVYLEYSIEIPEVGENINTAKLVGDVLYGVDDSTMGTVIGCSAVQTKHTYVMVDEIVLSQENIRYITVTVECEAIRMKNGSYRIEESFMSVGDDLTLYSDDFMIEGTCVRITEVIK